EEDTFSFFFDGLPAGWSSAAHEITIGAGVEDRAQPGITPAANADTGWHDVTLVGESTDGSVREETTLTVNVVLEPSSIDYTGETYVPIGEPAGFEAAVTMQSDNSPILGAEVMFELTGPDGNLTVSGTSDANGVASADPIIDLSAGDYDLAFSMDRFGKHAPASGNVTFRVPTVAERIGDLIEDIAAAGLKRGIENSLTSKLGGALKHVEAERSTPACNMFGAFSNHVNAQSGKHIPETTADELLHDVDGISAQFGCDA
ncbi:MAG: hypothetical protein WD401_05550, partial [Thermomicrobiaceae bacterium]